MQQDRQVHYVVNWIRKLKTVSKNLVMTTKDYKNKTKQAAHDEENLRKQAIKTGDDTNYQVSAVRRCMWCSSFGGEKFPSPAQGVGK